MTLFKFRSHSIVFQLLNMASKKQDSSSKYIYSLCILKILLSSACTQLHDLLYPAPCETATPFAPFLSWFYVLRPQGLCQGLCVLCCCCCVYVCVSCLLLQAPGLGAAGGHQWSGGSWPKPLRENIKDQFLLVLLDELAIFLKIKSLCFSQSIMCLPLLAVVSELGRNLSSTFEETWKLWMFFVWNFLWTFRFNRL